jgi:rhodanese-related sulfurtransferase
MQHSEGFLNLVHDAKSRVREIDPQTVQQKLDRGDKFHFIDVREDDEWKSDHANRAEHLGRGVIERDIETKIPDHSAEIVLYCGGGYRSALAADNLQKMGYTNVLSMAGGIKAWREQDLPMTMEIPF